MMHLDEMTRQAVADRRSSLLREAQNERLARIARAGEEPAPARRPGGILGRAAIAFAHAVTPRRLAGNAQR